MTAIQLQQEGVAETAIPSWLKNAKLFFFVFLTDIY